MAFPQVQISVFFFFPGEHAPGPPPPIIIIRAFEADSPHVSPVTLVLNVQ